MVNKTYHYTTKLIVVNEELWHHECALFLSFSIFARYIFLSMRKNILYVLKEAV